jgi:acyl-CoA synthetase (AMP-forming)/AMP-acid ligase II
MEAMRRMEFNLARVHEAISAAIPDRVCIVTPEKRHTFGDITMRTRRLANYLRTRGLGCRRERADLANHESGQDHVALYLYNGVEYLEGMLGSYKARTAPFNVNYRYVEEELVYLLRDAEARAILYHASFAPTLAKVLPHVPSLKVLLQVEDGSGTALLPGAVDYETALGASSDALPDVTCSPDDLYILYTGGTTGMPKGVLWRQADIFVTALGGQTQAQTGEEFDSLEPIVARAVSGQAAMRVLPSPPFMHGAAHWSAFHTFHMGGTIVIPGTPRHLVADDIWSTVEREKVQALLIVGDAFGRPLLDGLSRRKYDLSSLALLISGGAPLNAALKKRFIEEIPQVIILDAVGSSETGSQAHHMSTRGGEVSTGTFRATPNNVVVSEDMTRVLAPGDPEMGWFARTGRVPLGYLGDAAKTARTFPVIGGVRCSVPGDRARMRADGTLELYGRDSVTINSGGEKIFAEEVEHAIKHHPAVYDAVVVGRPSERWGSEVVAVVRLRAGSTVGEAELLAECEKHLARYKLPKAFVFRDDIVRSPSGKADYRWARSQVS